MSGRHQGWETAQSAVHVRIMPFKAQQGALLGLIEYKHGEARKEQDTVDQCTCMGSSDHIAKYLEEEPMNKLQLEAVFLDSDSGIVFIVGEMPTVCKVSEQFCRFENRTL